MHKITLTIPATGLAVDELLASLLGGLPVIPSGSLVLRPSVDGSDAPQQITFTGHREFLVALVYLINGDALTAHMKCREIEEITADDPPELPPLNPPRRALTPRPYGHGHGDRL